MARLGSLRGAPRRGCGAEAGMARAATRYILASLLCASFLQGCASSTGGAPAGNASGTPTYYGSDPGMRGHHRQGHG